MAGRVWRADAARVAISGEGPRAGRAGLPSSLGLPTGPWLTMSRDEP